MKYVLVTLQQALHAAAALPGQGQVRTPPAVSVEQVLDAAVGLGVDAVFFDRYARLRWGRAGNAMPATGFACWTRSNATATIRRVFSTRSLPV